MCDTVCEETPQKQDGLILANEVGCIGSRIGINSVFGFGVRWLWRTGPDQIRTSSPLD